MIPLFLKCILYFKISLRQIRCHNFVNFGYYNYLKVIIYDNIIIGNKEKGTRFSRISKFFTCQNQNTNRKYV